MNTSINRVFFNLGIIGSIFLTMQCAHPFCGEVSPPPNKNENVIQYNLLLKSDFKFKDAVVTNYYAENNYDSLESIFAMCITNMFSNFIEMKGLIDFDIKSRIPQGANIKKASLKLYADTVNTYGFDAFSFKGGHLHKSSSLDFSDWHIQKITEPWDESELTWFNIPSVNETINEQAPSYNYQSYTIDVTELVREKLNGGKCYGIMLTKNENQEGSIVFCSSEHHYAELKPELYIEYEK